MASGDRSMQMQHLSALSDDVESIEEGSSWWAPGILCMIIDASIGEKAAEEVEGPPAEVWEAWSAAED